MNIHEFQAKEILKRFGVAVPRGIVASTAEEAKKAADELSGGVCVVKAQIHAGGRGKGGGGRVVKNSDQAAEAARAMVGRNLVSHQAGLEGREVRRGRVGERLDIGRRGFVALVRDVG